MFRIYGIRAADGAVGTAKRLGAERDVDPYAFGLIEEPLARALDVLRQIRNRAAHAYEKFDLEAHRTKVSALLKVVTGIDTHEHYLARHMLNFALIAIRSRLLTFVKYRRLEMVDVTPVEPQSSPSPGERDQISAYLETGFWPDRPLDE